MVKYDILPSSHLRVPNKNETLENIDKDGIALHIDPFDLGLRLSLPNYRVFIGFKCYGRSFLGGVLLSENKRALPIKETKKFMF